MTRQDRRWERGLLYGAFALSGAAGLIYELLWSRYLALLVGHSAYAQVLVIGLFLGGMAVGALGAGRVSESLRRPLLWYAGAEVALAVAGLAFHPMYEALSHLAYDRLLPPLAGTRWPGAVRWTLAGAMIFPQSVLLGTTFPLMAAGGLRRLPMRSGRWIADLYFVNSVGAAVGVLLAGFLLVAAFGLPGSLAAAAALNLAAAAGVMLVESGPSRSRAVARGRGPRDRTTRAGGTAPPAGLLALLLALSALTAVASFGYEIGWIRMLSLVMGSATHSFELMLSAFILGLALGSLAIRRAADRSSAPLKLLGWIQWGMGASALATLPVYAFSFHVMAWLLGTLPTDDGGYLLFGAARYAIALAVMLPSSFLAGTTLPLITNTLLRAGSGERAIGRVYGWNTVGSIAGVALAGLLLLPWLGLEGLIVAAASLDMALGVVALAWWTGTRGGSGAAPLAAPLAALLLAAAVAVGISTSVWLDRAVLTSGVFRWAELPGDRPLLYYADGRTATIGAYLTGADSLVVLSSNGKPDASLTLRWLRAQAGPPPPPVPIVQQDESTQYLSGLVALAHAPDARRAIVVGHGSGMTAHALLAHPGLEELVTIEIEPRMIDGSLVFLPANRRAFDDPRSRFMIDDARSRLVAGAGTVDLVVSEPSNPWVSGTSGLFTVEFYRRVRARMAADGVFAQWFHLYESRDDLVLSVLAALDRVFGSFRAYLVGRSDLLIVATPALRLPDPDWTVFRHPGVVRDLAHVPPFTPGHLDGLEAFSSAALAPLLRSWPTPNSDFRPVLELGAEKARFFDAFADGTYGLITQRFDLAAALAGRRRPFVPYAEVPVLGLAPLWELSVGAWLRTAGIDDGSTARTVSGTHAAYLRRHRRLLRELSASDAPDDWGEWMERLTEEEAVLHGGTVGTADTAFFDAVHRALERWDAPAEARAGARFLEGAARLDHAVVVDAAGPLIRAAERGSAWMDPERLLDATVAAHLALGEGREARETYERLRRLAGRPPDDLRTLLLEAWLEGATGGAR